MKNIIIILFFIFIQLNDLKSQIAVTDEDFLKEKNEWLQYFSNRNSLSPIEGIWIVKSDKYIFKNKNLELQLNNSPSRMNQVAIYKTDSGFAIKLIGLTDSINNFFVARLDNNHDSTSLIFNCKFRRSSEEVNSKEVLVSDTSIYLSFWLPKNELYHRLEIDASNSLENYSQLTRMNFTKLYPKISKIEKSGPRIATGTGFAITGDILVTNYHVIANSNSIYVKGLNGDFTTKIPAITLLLDKENDIAIIQLQSSKILEKLPYVVRPNSLDVGESVFTLGFPYVSTMGEEVKLTSGIISALSGFQNDNSTFQISTPIQPGNSGGPVFNSAGQLIGIICAKHLNAENVSYAIKIKYLLTLLNNSAIPISINTNNQIDPESSLQKQVKQIRDYVFIIENHLKTE